MRWKSYFKLHITQNLASPAELFWIFLYPLVGVLSLGVMSMYLKTQGVGFEFIHFVLVGTMFWDFLSLSQKGITYGTLYPIWEKYMKQIYLSPIRVRDYILGNGLFGLVAAIIAFIYTNIISQFLFGFNLLGLGTKLLLPLFTVFLFGVAIGMIIVGLTISRAYAFSSLTWGFVGVVMIFSGVYYPVTALPENIQLISRAIPITYSIDYVRGILISDGTTSFNILTGFLISCIYFVISSLFLKYCTEDARKSGMITRFG